MKLEYNDVIFGHNPDIASFYKNFNNTEFTKMKAKKLIELKEKAKKLNRQFLADNQFSQKSKYIRIMNKIRTNPKGYSVTNDLEKYILFMFSIDPNYDLTYLYASIDRIQDIKVKMAKKFGVYDPNLILI